MEKKTLITKRICETLGELTERDQILLDQEIVVARLNRVLIGWANYFCLGPVRNAYRAVDQHARKRLRPWLCAKLKVSAARAANYTPGVTTKATLRLLEAARPGRNSPGSIRE